MKTASYIDHTALKPDTTEKQIVQLCAEAREYGFASVCVNPTWVNLCFRLLAGTKVKVCAVIGFPLGANLPEAKAVEAKMAINHGAQEIDMVINIGALRSGNFKLVEDEIRLIKKVVGQLTLKVIIETCLLSDDEKTIACQLAKRAGADFVKTSTGFSSGGATVDDILLMRKAVGQEMGVKASGGIKDLATAKAMIEAGASRLGCSAGVAIVKEEEKTDSD
jgi:deoxyribose-phosphate aldolase